MFSLESQIEPYTDASFSAEVEAQHFFKSYGEADISKKLQEMASIQQSIETVLRQKVRANYGMFLVANDEINQVDEEMSDLKHLISNTQKLIEDVQANRIDDSRAMRTNSFLGKFAIEEDDQNESVNAMNKAIADAKNSVPVWLAKAPEELAQFIVEQQYSKAVVIVLKTRAYVNTISHELHLSLNKNNTTSTSTTTTNNIKNYRNSVAATQAAEIAAAVASAQTEAIIAVLNRIDELCVHLAGTIRKSILNLPTSALWGKTEQFRLLKLLIALEEFDMAAEGFEITQLNAIKKSLHIVEYSGDTVIYTTELSNSFFLALFNSCSIFKALYNDYYERPEILNLLLVWLQKQISNYVEILVPQMHAGITDLSNNVLNSLRKACAAAAASTSSSSVLQDSGEGFPDLDSIYGGGGSGPTIQSIMEELVIKSPLNVLSGCLEGAFRAAHYIDGPQLQGSSCLGWILIPEVQLVVTAYAERFLEQVGAQVRQDSWQPVQLRDLAMRSPARNSAPFEFIGLVEEGGEEGALAQLDDASQHPVSRSYEWLQAVLNHLSSEVWKLLKAEDEDEQEPSRDNTNSRNTATGTGGTSSVPFGGGSSNKPTASCTSPSYTRADVCEVESVAVGCMIRLFIRYIVEIEALTTKGFTKMQSNCYLKTLEALVTYLLPSLEHVVTTCYFAEGVNGLHASPSYVFKTLKPRLVKLLKDRQR